MDNETRQENPLAEEARIHDADWLNRFIEVHLHDVCDSKYQLFKSDNRSLSLRIQNGRIDFTGIDYGDACEMMNGTDEYNLCQYESWRTAFDQYSPVYKPLHRFFPLHRSAGAA